MLLTKNKKRELVITSVCKQGTILQSWPPNTQSYWFLHVFLSLSLIISFTVSYAIDQMLVIASARHQNLNLPGWNMLRHLVYDSGTIAEEQSEVNLVCRLAALLLRHHGVVEQGMPLNIAQIVRFDNPSCGISECKQQWLLFVWRPTILNKFSHWTVHWIEEVLPTLIWTGTYKNSILDTLTKVTEMTASEVGRNSYIQGILVRSTVWCSRTCLNSCVHFFI